MLKLWLLEQTEITGYSTFDSCVVVAESEEEAKTLHPCGGKIDEDYYFHRGWASKPENVKATYLGVATSTLEPGIVITSFNAG